MKSRTAADFSLTQRKLNPSLAAIIGFSDTNERTTLCSEVEFVLGDALDMNVCDWSDATVVFANSTCFDDGLMRRMASAATALKKGTIFITLTKRLPVQTECVWLLYFCLKFMTPSRRIDVYIYVNYRFWFVCCRLLLPV